MKRIITIIAIVVCIFILTVLFFDIPVEGKEYTYPTPVPVMSVVSYPSWYVEPVWAGSRYMCYIPVGRWFKCYSEIIKRPPPENIAIVWTQER